ncbi:MAG: hypothetical protein HQK84_01495 [Nitrospinae bacterium]|nr:hypothetical protein [Nitrospinota bacterium]
MSQDFISNLSLEVNFPIYYKVIENEKTFDELNVYIKENRSIDREGLPSNDIFLTIQEKFSRAEYSGKKLNQELKDILSHLEKKIDVLIKLLAFNKDNLKKEFNHEAYCKQLSCHELYMSAQDGSLDGANIHLYLEPPIFPPLHINLAGRVSKKGEGYKVTFSGLNTYDQEDILSYLIKREREIIRSKKN